MAAPKILKLDEVVINRIAAGEVIQRPANAIKEMVENSIDAKSKSIQITVKSGGLKLIQIQDDGCGVRKEDMKVVCERFTTSKLSTFDDLRSISTYGFRGEALASISHVAHLTITTKTSDAPCAFKAKYEDGKLVPLQPGGAAEPKPCAGNKGTQISVEDLFYNVAVRRKAFKSPSEEHSKIADMISKYAIHNPAVGFSLKKFGESIAHIRTPSNSSILNNIKIVYGPTVSRELLEISQKDEKLAYEMKGYISNANYSVKKLEFLLFINHRLVESSSLKKALEIVYVNYLPKDKHPFVYLSLEISPMNVDVNVHPTKHEVKFLYEDMIIESIQKCVENALLGSNESRHFYTQMFLPKIASAGSEFPVSGVLEGKSNTDITNKVYDHQLVRTDSRERKLQAFFSPLVNKDKTGDESVPVNDTITKQESNKQPNPDTIESMEVDLEDSASVFSDVTTDQSASFSKIIPVDDAIGQPIMTEKAYSCATIELSSGGHSDNEKQKSDKHQKQTLKQNDGNQQNAKAEVLKTRKRSHGESSRESGEERVIRLSSVKTLRKRIDDQEHLGLKNLLEDHKFVGCASKSSALVQHLTRLYLVNTEKLSQELFYQILMFKFGNFGYIELSSPAPIYELIMLALDSPDSGWTPEDGEKEELAKFVVDLLKDKSEMLMDYFSVQINENGELLTLPILLDKYIPNWNKLPIFLLRLATEVDWDSELECFDTFCRECSRFYAFGHDMYADEDEDDIDSEKSTQWKHTVEHVIYPALRSSIVPPKSFSEDGTFLEVANLPDLYKVFERC